METWQMFALGLAGTIIGALLTVVISPLLKALTKSKQDEIDDLKKKQIIAESKLDNLDKTFAVKLQDIQHTEEKINTYFMKMDKALEMLSEAKLEAKELKIIAKSIESNQEEYTTLFNKLNVEVLDTVKETRQLNVTNKKRQLLLEKQVSKVSEKVGIPFDYDPDLFLDMENLKRFKGGD